jgi:iron(III) transport system ATP-binding protein
MIRISNLSMTYRSGAAVHPAVNGVSMMLEQGQFYTLLGPSGCGKTSTLRCVAGLERPDSGEISIDGEVVYSSELGICVPPFARNIGMVFQSYAIWPHMTVFDNVAFPLRQMRPRPGANETQDRVRAALALVHLDHLADRPAPYLSGGQQQRLALARALVGNPRVLLLDEPLSNLDAKLREEMRFEIRKLVKELRLTTLFVTHEQIEALTMSDVVAVMRDGRIVQAASPTEIYLRPSEPYIADFIGKANLIAAELASHGDGKVATAASDIGPIACRAVHGIDVGMRVYVVIRPENIAIANGQDAAPANRFRGQVRELSFLGNLLDCFVDVGPQTLRVQVHPLNAPARGETVELHLPEQHCMAIRAGELAPAGRKGA